MSTLKQRLLKRHEHLKQFNDQALEIIDAALALASDIEVDRPADSAAVRMEAAMMENLRKEGCAHQIALIEDYLNASAYAEQVRDDAHQRIRARVRQASAYLAMLNAGVFND